MPRTWHTESMLLSKMRVWHLFICKHEELTAVAPTISKLTDKLLASEQTRLPDLHPGFPLVASYKEFNLFTLFKSDISLGHREMERKGRTKHRDYSL